MKTTGNLGLKKPDGTDIVDITDLNGNMDILDTAVKAVQDHAADAVKHITAADRTAWNAKASTAAATASAAGLMAAADKAKLDGVAAGANNYVHPNHTGDVTSTGDGVTAIAPGVIVNADVNAAAAIDATKIGTGVVTNAEFGYLDGVTAGIQGQLNGKSPTVDYVRQPAYSITAGTGAAYTVNLTPAPASLPEGFGITIVPNLVNTAGPTLNVNGLGAIPLKDQKGIAYAAGKLLAGKPYMFRKVGTDFLADSAGGSGNAVAGDIRAGKTAATDAGDVTGTLAVQTGGTVTPGASAVVKAAGIYDADITVAGVSVPAANVLTGTTIAGTAGTMPNNGAVNRTPSNVAQSIPAGYTSGGTVAAVTVPAANVLAGTTIAGTVGTMPNRANDQSATTIWTNGAGQLSVGFPTGAYVTNSGFGTGIASTVIANGNFIASNIRSGVDIFNVVGTMQPKLYASGSGTVLNTVYPAKDISNSTPGGEMGYVSVGGLAFKPEFIRLKTTDSMSIVWNVPQDGVTYCFWRKVGIGNVYLFTSQTMGGYVYTNSSGFGGFIDGWSSTISVPFTWEAWG
ncbi:hypothetical protein [Paenibacillus sp. FSL R5-0912]|uniref:hypothetical protein n=1 Tax=Paenibacillus sp. FSL R5-0912 TaxID=1536771 RepID=UPI0004F83C96|nr:hypothetical protein [Paenibacillus sp. FSL R5-0912]AIQ43830.1 hypothetical protein R50912_30400 [Paenibacillus sp. FSL R5-0912]